MTWPDEPESWEVEVALPGEAPFARVARTTTASYATLHGFSVDGLSDVRLLVDEVFTVLAFPARRGCTCGCGRWSGPCGWS